MMYYTVPYQYNVLRAFLHDDYTQRRGRTGSRGAGSCRQAGGAGLSAASRKVARPLSSGSSYSDFSLLHGGPCPNQSGGNAPGLTACSSAHLPVLTFPIQLYSTVRKITHIFTVKFYEAWIWQSNTTINWLNSYENNVAANRINCIIKKTLIKMIVLK